MNYFDDKIKIKPNKNKKDEPREEDLEFTSEENGDVTNGVFINSLNELTEDDIELSCDSNKIRPSGSELVRRAVLVISAAVFIVSCVLLVDNYISRQRGQDIYDGLRDDMASAGFDFSDLNTDADGSGSGKDDGGKNGAQNLKADSAQSALVSMSEINAGNYSGGEITQGETSALMKMRAGLKSLAEVNPDIYGWISVSDTRIDYPMAQGKDNSFYLDHAYTGDLSVTGSIFVDFRCEKKIGDNYNTVLYGHNLTTGGMFHDVTKFFNDDYFNNTYINIYTMDGIYVYEPFALYESRYDYNYFRTEFDNAEEFVAFAREVRDNSYKKKDIDFTGEDRILTLSTCTNGAFYMRYAMHARLVKVITE